MQDPVGRLGQAGRQQRREQEQTQDEADYQKGIDPAYNRAGHCHLEVESSVHEF